MKRTIAILLTAFALTFALAGCSGTGNGNTVSTTPNGTVNGGENSTTGSTTTPETGTTTRPNGSNGTTMEPGTSTGDNATTPNGNSGNTNTSDQTDNNVVQDFGRDMEHAAENARDMIDDAVQSRQQRTGTGMTGGR